MVEYKLRPYQQEFTESVLKSYERGINRQLGVAFTGAGKSFMLVWLAKQFSEQGKRILVLCDQNDLVWQWQKNFQKFAPNLTVGIEKAEFKSKKSDQIVVGSVQTLGRKGKKRIKKFSQEHFDCVFTDECDKSITPTWIRILEYFGVGQDNFIDGNLLLGVTATPYRTSGESMGILYDDIVANYDIRYGISQGWLTDIELYNVQTNTDISNVKTNAGDFTISDLSDTINTSDRNAQILKSYKELSDGEQAIIYCADVAHAYAVSDLFNAHDIASEVIEANTDKQDRKEYMNEFDTGNIDVLCNYSTMSRGIDFPELRSIIFARPVKSKNLFTQILGRVLRTSETAEVDKYPDPQSRKFAIETSDKPVAKVIDLCDEAGKHNVVHLPSLFGLHDKLQPKKKQKFFKEVVEPLDRLKKEKKVDVSKIENLDEIELIVNKRNYELKSLELDDTVKEFTNRSWVETTNGYEISYAEEDKVLIIESDDSSQELLDKSSWNLLEYDTDSGVTKNLQTFQSLSGAFKVADEYADQQGWDKQFMEKADWWDEGVTSAQIKWLNKFYRYKSGYSEFETINERYEDTKLKKIRWKKNSHGISEGTILTKKLASQLLQKKFGK